MLTKGIYFLRDGGASAIDPLIELLLALTLHACVGVTGSGGAIDVRYQVSFLRGSDLRGDYGGEAGAACSEEYGERREIHKEE